MRHLDHFDRAIGLSTMPDWASASAFELAGFEDGEQCLSSLLKEVSQELRADGMMVAWHHDLQQPTLLFAEGECSRGTRTERELIEFAARSARNAGLTDQAVSGPVHQGSSEVLTATIPLRQSIFTISGIFRRKSFGQHDRPRAILTRLLPLLRPFFRLWLDCHELARRLRGVTAAIDNSSVATFFLSCRGEVLFVNRAGREMLDQDVGISAEGGLLTAATMAETLRLRAAVEHVCMGRKDDAAMTPVLALRRDDRRPLMVTLVAAEPGTADPMQRTAIAYAFDPDQDLTQLIEPACRFYGLSPCETRLTSSLAQGASLTEAARALSVRDHTARSYLKQIFLKTETNRQAELVGLMLKSAVHTAPKTPTRVF
ncbi:MAG TPA: helix-turn-helix transcriptional regulator [Croceibacterium sp.]|nr:helix-turn-helix transcriptional regulator [Croceibacterium sp.]